MGVRMRRLWPALMAFGAVPAVAQTPGTSCLQGGSTGTVVIAIESEITNVDTQEAWRMHRQASYTYAVPVQGREEGGLTIGPAAASDIVLRKDGEPVSVADADLSWWIALPVIPAFEVDAQGQFVRIVDGAKATSRDAVLQRWRLVCQDWDGVDTTAVVQDSEPIGRGSLRRDVSLTLARGASVACGEDNSQTCSTRTIEMDTSRAPLVNRYRIEITDAAGSGWPQRVLWNEHRGFERPDRGLQTTQTSVHTETWSWTD